jgi:hypothetical protein
MARDEHGTLRAFHNLAGIAAPLSAPRRKVALRGKAISLSEVQ